MGGKLNFQIKQRIQQSNKNRYTKSDLDRNREASKEKKREAREDMLSDRQIRR